MSLQELLFQLNFFKSGLSIFNLRRSAPASVTTMYCEPSTLSPVPESPPAVILSMPTYPPPVLLRRTTSESSVLTKEACYTLHTSLIPKRLASLNPTYQPNPHHTKPHSTDISSIKPCTTMRTIHALPTALPQSSPTTHSSTTSPSTRIYAKNSTHPNIINNTHQSSHASINYPASAKPSRSCLPSFTLADRTSSAINLADASKISSGTAQSAKPGRGCMQALSIYDYVPDFKKYSWRNVYVIRARAGDRVSVGRPGYGAGCAVM